MGERLPIGVPVLDRRLGGDPPGHLLAVLIPPGSRGHLLLRALARLRETHHLTTARTPAEIRRGLGTGASKERVTRVPPQELLDETDRHVAPLGDRRP